MSSSELCSSIYGFSNLPSYNLLIRPHTLPGISEQFSSADPLCGDLESLLHTLRDLGRQAESDRLRIHLPEASEQRRCIQRALAKTLHRCFDVCLEALPENVLGARSKSKAMS